VGLQFLKHFFSLVNWSDDVVVLGLLVCHRKTAQDRPGLCWSISSGCRSQSEWCWQHAVKPTWALLPTHLYKRKIHARFQRQLNKEWFM
jgi:hypothetical protein